MRTYSQIEGDGGSGVAGQIAELEAAIARRMAGIRHVVAVGSGKGGVGKSTLTRAARRRARGRGQARGHPRRRHERAEPGDARRRARRAAVPGEEGLLLPVSRDGLKVLSVGSLLAEGEALPWPSASPRHSHVWRATRELAKLAELLAAVHWGPLDMLLVDLPPGPERTAQFADFLGPQAAVLLVSIPSALARGVVARSVSALGVLPNRLLGHVENMSGYACAGCGTVRPLFPESREAAELALPCLGRVPFDPQLAALSDEGRAITEARRGGPGRRGARRGRPQPVRRPGGAMKFLCVPCDTPMRLRATEESEPGSLAVVYSCPACGYEMAMLTNQHETDMVRSLGVRIGPAAAAAIANPGTAGSGSPAAASASPAQPLPVLRHARRAQPSPEPRPPHRKVRSGRREPWRAWSRSPRWCARWRAPGSRWWRGRTGTRSSTRRCSPTRGRGSGCEPMCGSRLQSTAVRPRRPSPGPTWCPGISPTAATSPVSTATSTPAPGKVKTPAFADRSELSTEQCCRVIDEIAAFAPECVTILTGGEPLLRRDIVEIIRYASPKGLWVVVGTNGVKITENLARLLQAEGVRGLALSLDALDAERHDTFRRVRGAWREHGRGGEDPDPRRPAVHRADHGRRAQPRGARRHRRLRPRRAGRQGLEPLLPRAERTRRPSSATSPPPSTTRCWRSSRNPAPLGLEDAGQRQVRPALRPHAALRRLAGPLPEELRRRRRRLPGGHPLHGDPSQRRRHPVPLPAALRRKPGATGLRRSGTPPTSSPGSASATTSAAAAAPASSRASAAAAAPAPTA